MPSFKDLDGNEVNIKPNSVKVDYEQEGLVILREADAEVNYKGTVVIKCSSAQAFKTIAKMVAAPSLMEVIEDCGRLIWNPIVSQAERRKMFLKLNDAFCRATGWHLTGTANCPGPMRLRAGRISPPEYDPRKR